MTAALGDGSKPAPFFRIPGLLRADGVERYLASQHLMVWSADFPADDWTKISPAQVYARALQRIEANHKGILLLHDIQQRTVEALPYLLKELKRRGYRIVQVVPATPDMAEDRNRSAPVGHACAHDLAADADLYRGGNRSAGPQSGEFRDCRTLQAAAADVRSAARPHALLPAATCRCRRFRCGRAAWRPASRRRRVARHCPHRARKVSATLPRSRPVAAAQGVVQRGAANHRLGERYPPAPESLPPEDAPTGTAPQVRGPVAIINMPRGAYP